MFKAYGKLLTAGANEIVFDGTTINQAVEQGYIDGMLGDTPVRVRVTSPYEDQVTFHIDELIESLPGIILGDEREGLMLDTDTRNSRIDQLKQLGFHTAIETDCQWHRMNVYDQNGDSWADEIIFASEFDTDDDDEYTLERIEAATQEAWRVVVTRDNWDEFVARYESEGQ